MSDKPMFEEAAILGLGLLGGSIARAGRKLGLIRKVTGFGRNEQRLKYALDNGIADSVYKDPVEAVREADLVVICTPVRLIPDILEKIALHLKDGAIVTDVGSTKTGIVEKAEQVLPASVNFIGGHPMAGSENSGIEASSDTLFENAICILTSSAKTNIGALNQLERFWEALRAKVLIMSPQEHDHLVAASSHLPHVVAVALTNSTETISIKSEKILPLLAGGFRDTTRIASGNPEMWRDICMENKDHIVSVLNDFIESAKEASELIKHGSTGELISLFTQAKQFRDELPSRGQGILEPVNELLVDVSDEPGIIGDITTALGDNNINLRNINVQHVREMHGGTLSIIIEKNSDMERAIELLKERGFSARAHD